MRILASSLAALDNLDRSLNILLGRWPELTEIRIDLSAMESLDDAAVVTLKRAIGTLSARRIHVTLDGVTPSIVQALVVGGISTAHIGVMRRTNQPTSCTS